MNVAVRCSLTSLAQHEVCSACFGCEASCATPTICGWGVSWLFRTFCSFLQCWVLSFCPSSWCQHSRASPVHYQTHYSLAMLLYVGWNIREWLAQTSEGSGCPVWSWNGEANQGWRVLQWGCTECLAFLHPPSSSISSQDLVFYESISRSVLLINFLSFVAFLKQVKVFLKVTEVESHRYLSLVKCL